MANVAVVTDTTHYVPRELLRAADIREVSLYVNHESRQEREAEMADFSAFYEELRLAETVPTTSQPSIGDFLECYEPLAAEGCDIVSVHIAGGISGTVESARQAAAELVERRPERRVEVDQLAHDLRRPRAGRAGRRSGGARPAATSMRSQSAFTRPATR